MKDPFEIPDGCQYYGGYIVLTELNEEKMLEQIKPLSAALLEQLHKSVEPVGEKMLIFKQEGDSWTAGWKCLGRGKGKEQ